MIVIHASFPIDPDRREEALDLIADLVDESQAEDGILDYRATTDIAEPNVVRFFERYEDEAAVGAHARSDHYQEFEATLPELLAGEPEVTRFDVDSAEDVEL
ncbi:antibiotic biosynthesis monooxygenase [Natrinema thermotolerans]|uniref:Antibiotic biosynthesis monooxygenase n=1 Tax=Natrinema thermotolerans TaxID=121872 RepID=A0AAF0PEA4_9EURY|nr:putative quinol monooxygenase [Natrinema thermotolerans]WMT08894.1 antibiotic biosynthesis monooxygenase [Natrinema thermotolerans]